MSGLTTHPMHHNRPAALACQAGAETATHLEAVQPTRWDGRPAGEEPARSIAGALFVADPDVV
eukprot:8050762-Prorocentrum_lima.AAC.1